jgi:hypothetical protein
MVGLQARLSAEQRRPRAATIVRAPEHEKTVTIEPHYRARAIAPVENVTSSPIRATPAGILAPLS